MSNCSTHEFFMGDCDFMFNVKSEFANKSEITTIYTPEKITKNLPCSDHKILDGRCFEEQNEADSSLSFHTKSLILLISGIIIFVIILRCCEKKQKKNINFILV